MPRSIGLVAQVFLLAMLTTIQTSAGKAHDLKPGLYRVTVALEFPHLRNAVDQREVQVCLSADDLDAHRGFRILSDVPQAQCVASPICFGAGRAGFQTICPGENTGEALGEFAYRGDHFSGTVNLKFGGKNMTVIERQSGIWIGPCQE